jgi:hypothetical protein
VAVATQASGRSGLLATLGRQLASGASADGAFADEAGVA